MLRSLISTLLIAMTFVAAAQEYTGLVVNERTGVPIAFAGFVTGEGHPITVSNRDGVFRLCAENLQKVQVAAPGFEPQYLDPSGWPKGRRTLLKYIILKYEVLITLFTQLSKANNIVC